MNGEASPSTVVRRLSLIQQPRQERAETGAFTMAASSPQLHQRNGCVMAYCRRFRQGHVTTCPYEGRPFRLMPSGCVTLLPSIPLKGDRVMAFPRLMAHPEPILATLPGLAKDQSFFVWFVWLARASRPRRRSGRGKTLGSLASQRSALFAFIGVHSRINSSGLARSLPSSCETLPACLQ